MAVERNKDIYLLCIKCYNCKKSKNGKIRCSEGYFEDFEEKNCTCSPLDYDCFNYED